MKQQIIDLDVVKAEVHDWIQVAASCFFGGKPQETDLCLKIAASLASITAKAATSADPSFDVDKWQDTCRPTNEDSAAGMQRLIKHLAESTGKTEEEAMPSILGFIASQVAKVDKAEAEPDPEPDTETEPAVAPRFRG